METVTYKKDFSEQKKCPHCGSSMKMYWHSLSYGLVEMLVQFSKKLHESVLSEIHPIEDCHFSYSQGSNFQKLRYFDLVDKGEKVGYWQVTETGREFLKNKAMVPMKVLSWRGEVKDKSHKYIRISEIMTGYPSTYWEDHFDFKLRTSRIGKVEEEDYQAKLLNI